MTPKAAAPSVAPGFANGGVFSRLNASARSSSAVPLRIGIGMRRPIARSTFLSSFVIVGRVTPVAVLVAVTVAPGTAAPWASLSRPLISPPPICAHAGRPADSSHATARNANSRIERIE